MPRDAEEVVIVHVKSWPRVSTATPGFWPVPQGSQADGAAVHAAGLIVRVWLPLLLTLVAAAALAVPIMDTDAYWHVLMGIDIATFGRLGGDPGWVFGPGDPHWVTTQPVAELVMAAAHAVWGWPGVAALPSLVLLPAASIGWWVLLARRNAPDPKTWPARLGVFAGLLLVWVTFAVTRPAIAGWMLCPLAGLWAWRILTQSTLSTRPIARWWLVAGVGVLWVNLHGSWLLLPVVLVSAVAVRLVAELATGIGTARSIGTTDGFADVRAGWPASIAAVWREVWRGIPRGTWPAVGVACGVWLITPDPVNTVTAPWRFTQIMPAIPVSEWTTTMPLTWQGGFLVAATVLVLVVAWRAYRVRPVGMVGPLLFAVGWLAFAWTAYRNVPPALLLLVPTLAGLVGGVWPWRGWRMKAAWTQVSPLLGGLVVIAVPVVVVFSVSAVRVDGGYTNGTPQAIIKFLGGRDEPVRLVGEYTLTSIIHADHPDIQVGFDGRLDRYDPTWSAEYSAAWRGAGNPLAVLQELPTPTHAVVHARSTSTLAALSRVGWVPVVLDQDWVLLRAPRN